VPTDSLLIEPYFRLLPGCEGILRAIAAEPDDDTHRLVLADWLADNGEPERAELIRLQCRLAGIPEWLTWMLPGEPGRRALRLQIAHRKRWAKGVLWAEFARGMVEGLWLSGESDDWLELLRRARKKHAIRRLRAELRREDWAVFAREALTSLPLGELELSVDGPLGAEEMTTLVHSPCFGLLRLLTVQSRSLTAPAVSLLAEASAPRLRRLSLGSGLGDEGITLFARARGFPQLRQLCLSYNQMGREGALALATHPVCEKVTHLDLAHNRLGDAGLAALASSPCLDQLRALNLRQNDIGSEGAARLARSRLLARLLHLNLYDNSVAQGVADLSRSQQSATLETLDLTGNRIQPEGLERLTGSPTWARMVTLGLGGNNLDDATLAALVSGLVRIESLGLYGNWIGPAGLSALIASNHLGGLKHLDLGGNPIGSEGAKAIAGCADLEELTHLGLCNCEIRVDGMLALARSPHLHKLTHLDLRYNRGYKAARPFLQARFFPASGA
jgi:uncharacterized protein (TIGR02996 family)